MRKIQIFNDSYTRFETSAKDWVVRESRRWERETDFPEVVRTAIDRFHKEVLDAFEAGGEESAVEKIKERPFLIYNKDLLPVVTNILKVAEFEEPGNEYSYILEIGLESDSLLLDYSASEVQEAIHSIIGPPTLAHEKSAPTKLEEFLSRRPKRTAKRNKVKKKSVIFKDREPISESDDSLAKRFRAIERDIVQFEASLLGRAEKLEEDVAELVQEKGEIFSTFMSSLEDESRRLSDFFKTNLALEQPVRYWKNAKEYHQDRQNKYFYAMIAIFAFLAAGLASSIAWGGVLDFLKTVSLPGAGLLLFTASIVIWFLQINTRLFISSYHQRADASERETMLLVFLSLMEQDAIEKDQINLALSSVFRPGLTGLVKDESAPQWQPSALLSRVLGK